MKNQKKNVTVALSVLALTSLYSGEVAFAQNITCPEPLIFGEITPCGTAGSVTVRPDTSRVLGGCVTAGGAPYSRARCIITQGFPFKDIQISIAPTAATITAGINTMTVNNFNLITNAGGPSTTISPGVPFVNVPIGATLNVGANQVAGSYNGTFVMTVILP